MNQSGLQQKKSTKRWIAFVLTVLVCVCSAVVYVSAESKAATVTMDREWASVAIGSTVQLRAQSSSSVTWKSSDTSLATVDQTGKVTGKSMGMVTITATSNGKTDTCQVSVGMTQGIDVSSWNQTVDWAKVKEHGVDFAIIRVGYGWEDYPNQIDKQFVNNVKGAVQNGIDFGLYFYSYATNADEAEQEAAYLLRALEDYVPGYMSSMTLPIAYDVEDPCMQGLSKDTMTAIVKTFCTEMQKAGYDAMVYSGKYSYFPMMDVESLREMGVTFWLAMYPNSPDFTTVPYMGSSAAQPAIWQYASDGDVDGANIPSSGHVDVNVRYMVPSVDSVSVTSSGGAKVSWKALSGAKSYTLYRRDNSTNKETVVKTGLTGTSYTDSSCPEGKDVYYYLTASTSQGTISGAYTGKQAYVLPTPELTSVKSTSSGITVNWKAVSNAQGYRIYRKNENGNWVGLANVSSSQNSYTDTTADPQKAYTYTVRAYRYGGTLGGGVLYYSGYETEGITSLVQPAFTLSNTASGVQISWDKVPSATKYRVYCRSGTTGDWTRLTETTSTSYTYQAKSGSTYYYTVRAFLDDDTYSAYRQDLAMKRLTQPEFTVSNTATGVQIDWSSVTGANKYRVYYRTEDMSGWTRLTETTDTSYIDTTAKSGVTYYYTVKAFSDNTYWSSYREDVKIKRLSQPNFTLSNTAEGVQIDWDKVTGATKYRVYYYSGTDGNWVRLAETTGTSYTYKAKEGSTYYYTVKAFSGNTYWSSYRKDVTFTRLTEPDFTLTNEENGVKISWDKVSGASKYRVYCRSGTTGDWTRLTETTSTGYTYKAKAGSTYYYTVKAFAKDGSYSTYRKDVSFKRLEEPDFSLTNTSTGVNISWGKVAGASKYRVYYYNGTNGNWVRLTETTGTSYTYKAKEGSTYYYTVKAFSGNTYWSSYRKDVTFTRLTEPDFTLSNYTAGVQVSWDAVEGATKYRVYRRTSTSDEWLRLTETAEKIYTDTTAVAGTTYYYTVKAFGADDSYSTYRKDETIKRLTRPEFTLANSSTGVQVNWEKVSGATKYRVYRKTSATGSWTQLTETTGSSYTDKTAKMGTMYYYTVRAFSGSTYSSYRTDQTIVRLAEPDFTLSNYTAGVKISWDAVEGATKYRVYRRTSTSAEWLRLTETSETTYTDTTAVAGTTYYYTVKAFGADNSCSTYRKDETIKRLTRPEFTLANSSTGVQVNWEKVSGATKYRVYRKTSATGSWTQLTETTGTSYTDTTAKAGTMYYYTVRAFSGSTYSSYQTDQTILYEK